MRTSFESQRRKVANKPSECSIVMQARCNNAFERKSNKVRLWKTVVSLSKALEHERILWTNSTSSFWHKCFFFLPRAVCLIVWNKPAQINVRMIGLFTASWQASIRQGPRTGALCGQISVGTILHLLQQHLPLSSNQPQTRTPKHTSYDISHCATGVSS